MWVFNIFLWMLMSVFPEIQEDEYYQLWNCHGVCTVPHPETPSR